MKILIAGDYCPHDRVVDVLEKRDFDSLFGKVKNVTSNCDYSIVNYECPVLKDGIRPIDKVGPNLCCSPIGVSAIKYAGFNCVTLANNHFLDYGEEGVSCTIEALNQEGLDYAGGGQNAKEASKILYKKIKGKSLAIINCCEHEFSIATESTAGSNPLNIVQQYYAINEARKNADYVLIIVHGGCEFFQFPSLRMKETYRFFIDAGADAVINHHQHCYSGYEFYKSKPIFYGLGNFCFDWEGRRNSIWNEGYLVELLFNDNNLSFNLYPYVQCSDSPVIELMDGSKKKQFFSNVSEMNTIISDSNMLKKKNEEWMDKDYKNQRNVFMPYTNRLLASACYRGFISDMLSKDKLLNFFNKIYCESHRDRLVYFIKKELERISNK